MRILTVLFKRQIMKYLGSNALAVYGPIIQFSTFVQCCAYSVGQASLPIISSNYGASKGRRIKETLRLALFTEFFFGIFWTVLSESCPTILVKFFMNPTVKILKVAKEKFNADAIRIESQLYAKDLYEKCGFIQVSRLFIDDGIEHIEIIY